MVFTAFLICIAGLLGFLGPWDTSYVCRVRSKLPEVNVREGRDGHFRPFTFCRSVAYSCSEGFCSSVKTWPTDVTMRCTIKDGTENSASASGGIGGPRMGSTGTNSTYTSASTWTQLGSQSGARPWTHTTRPRRPEQQGDSTSCAATGPGCFVHSLSPSSWETTLEGSSMRVSSGSLTASWPGLSTRQRTCQGLNWEGIMQESSQMFSDGCGLSCSTDTIGAEMRTAPLDQAPLKQKQATADEYNYFRGQVQTAPVQANHGFSFEACCSDPRHGQEQQGMRCSMHELNDFWQCSSLSFPSSFQDFQTALLSRQHERPSEHAHEPAPVPSPATQRANFSSAEATLLRRGEGWQSPRTAGSSGGAPCGRVGTMHVDSGHFNLQVAKRAYKRACRRAATSSAGGTWYRGRWVSSADLGNRYVSSSQQSQFSKAVAHDYLGDTRAKHFSLVSWNAGGLAAHNWDGLQNWLVTQEIQVCCIQETWWPYQRDWDNGTYFAIHHGAGRTGGLLTLISNRLASKECIRSGTLANGRVQHIRIYDPEGGLDILNVYQKVWSHASAEVVRAERQKVWEALADCLDKIPARNQVLIVGDMNVQLPSTTGVTGTAVSKQAYRDGRDEAELISILRQHGMIAINTFHDNQRFTYSHAGVKSQLDYVFAKGCQATGLSKQAHGLHDFPLLAARGEGSHVPIFAQLPRHWRIWKYGANLAHGRGHKAANQYLLQSQNVLMTHVQQALQQPVTSVAQIDHVLKEAQQAATASMPITSHSASRPWQDGDLRGVLSRAWWHLRQARSNRAKTLRSLFGAWRHAAQFLRLIQATRKVCRRLRRQKLLDILNTVQSEAHRQDMCGVFKIVDKIAPKRSRTRPQFRSHSGEILDVSEEAAANARFMRQLYASSETECFVPPPVLNNPLTQQDILENLKAIPSKKAGPSHIALSVVYRVGAEILAPVLYDFLQAWWNGGRPYIPQAWKDAWLILIPKPGRPCKGPGDMRPIGLSHPLGKAILRGLRAKIMPYALRYMEHVPQWGFIPGWEVADALARAFRHCQAVQTLCKQQSVSINNRMDGITRKRVAGGLAVALDISRAFDTVRRSETMLALQAADVPPALQGLVWEWIRGAQYHGNDNGGSWTVDVCRGVRQGCVLSPLLYILVVARLHSVLQSQFGALMCGAMDYYADDTLYHSTFESEQELVMAIRQVEFLLECLAQAGLDINDSKTQVLLQIRGTHAKQALKKYTECRKGDRFLRLSAFKQQRWIPNCAQAKYLGAQISYDSFADATVHRRIVSARATYGRLRKILTSRSSMSVRARIQLWRACVGAALFYAIDSSGVTLSGLRKIRVLVQKHLRASTRSLTHLTHLSNHALLDKYGVPERGAYIRDCMSKLVGRWNANADSATSIPIKACQEILQ